MQHVEYKSDFLWHRKAKTSSALVTTRQNVTVYCETQMVRLRTGTGYLEICDQHRWVLLKALTVRLNLIAKWEPEHQQETFTTKFLHRRLFYRQVPCDDFNHIYLMCQTFTCNGAVLHCGTAVFTFARDLTTILLPCFIISLIVVTYLPGTEGK